MQAHIADMGPQTEFLIQDLILVQECAKRLVARVTEGDAQHS